MLYGMILWNDTEAVVPGMYGTHCKHNSLVLSSVSNNISSSLYVDGGVKAWTHIGTYEIDERHNNNKITINSSLCCFTDRVVYTRITITWGKGI